MQVSTYHFPWFRYLSVVAVVYFLAGFHVLQTAYLDHGDAHSDGNVSIAGANFAQYGFKSTYFLPLYDFVVTPPQQGQLEAYRIYTHYPPLPELFNGLLRSLQIDSIQVQRIIAMGISLGAVLLLPLLLLELGLGIGISFWGSFAYLVNFEFLRYFDSLHQFPWTFLTSIAFAWAWVKFLRLKKPTYLVLALLSGWVSTWSSFEYFAFLPLFAFFSALYLKEFRQLWWAVFATGMVPVTTLLTRIWHNDFFYQNFRKTAGDLLGAASHRSSITWGDWAYYSQASLVDFFLVLTPALLALPVLKFLKAPRSEKSQALAWFWIFFFCGLSWWVLMRQHSAKHHHTILIFLPAFAILAGRVLHTNMVLWKTSNGALKKIAGGTLALIFSALLIKILATPIYTQFTGLPKDRYEKHQGKQQTLITAEEWGREMDPSHLLYIDSNMARPVAFHLGRPFQYITAINLCQSDFSSQSPLIWFAKHPVPVCLQSVPPAKEGGGLKLWTPNQLRQRQ